MSEAEHSRLKFSPATPPHLPAGEYTVTVTQSLTKPEVRAFPAASTRFRVDCPKFSVAAEDVYSLYPDRGDQGNFAASLPHLVFASHTLPWDRALSETDRNAAGLEIPDPWFALIVLTEAELPELRQSSIRELVADKTAGVFHPDYHHEPGTGEKVDANCLYFDIEASLIEDLFPRQEELPLLCHSREVDVTDKEDDIYALDGHFSVAVANRFPPAPVGKPTRCHALLLSLEGYRDRLPEGPRFEEIKRLGRARFIVLHHWEFIVEPTDRPGFGQLMEKLDCRAMSIPVPAISEPGIVSLVGRGQTPLRHHTRTGEATTSFYRGPLAPCPVELLPMPEAGSADAEIRYDPAYGIFALGYAAAWQLGRLLALKNKSIAVEIRRWRKEALREAILRDSRQMLRQRLNGSEANLPPDQARQPVYRELLGRLADSVGPAILDGSVTPLADPGR